MKINGFWNATLNENGCEMRNERGNKNWEWEKKIWK
jgi:hypothetical protein